MSERFQWTCKLCQVVCTSAPSRSNHMRNYWKESTDPTRCDNVARTALRTVSSTASVNVPILITPASSSSLVALARRPPNPHCEARPAYTITDTGVARDDMRILTGIQDCWDRYTTAIYNSCSPAFWNLFLQMHTFSIKAIDSALQAVKKTFVHDKQDRSRFPVSRRVLLEKIGALPDFWPQVLHTYKVDVRCFQLPSGCKEITFKFVDPLWGWLTAARQLHPLDLHWKPIAQLRGQKLYGGGVQYGECMREACRTIPAGAYPMLIGVHWDGTSAHGVDSAPICVCVGNTNRCDKSCQYCIGYIPHVPDEKKPEWKKQPVATRVKFYIRQKCFAAILRILEEGATRGVKVRLKNQRGEEVARLLYPKLNSCNFDQPEAQLVFGLQNKCGCTKCRQACHRLLYLLIRKHAINW